MQPSGRAGGSAHVETAPIGFAGPGWSQGGGDRRLGGVGTLKRTRRLQARTVQAIEIARRLAPALSRSQDREAWPPGAPVWLDVNTINRNVAGVEAIGLFMDLVMVVWLPSMRPFAFDAARLARILNQRLPDRGYSPEEIRRLKSGLATFFRPLADGRWTPRPEYLASAQMNVDGPVQ